MSEESRDNSLVSPVTVESMEACALTLAMSEMLSPLTNWTRASRTAERLARAASKAADAPDVAVGFAGSFFMEL
jgi:hypothetical protein